MAARREREALAGIAARRADDARWRLPIRGDLRQKVEAATDLERSGRRVVLVFHPHLAARSTSEQWPRVLRRRQHGLVNVLRGRLQFVEIDHAYAPGSLTLST